MANITFYLSSVADKKGLKPILIQITHNYQRERMPTGEKVKPSLWNKKKQRIIESKELVNEKEYARINTFLNDIDAKFKKLVSNSKLKEIDISAEYLKENLFRPDEKSKKTFFEVFDEYIETSKSIRASGTIVHYECAKNYFLAFEKETKYKISFSTINMTFFDKFMEYSFIKNNYRNNYVKRMRNSLCSMLNWAKDRGYYSGDIYTKFKVSGNDKEVIFLRLDELLNLNNYQFQIQSWNEARDLFCFCCFTGFRISDTLTLTKEIIDLRDGCILKWIKKTQQYEKIPLNSYALKILDKYKDYAHPLPKLAQVTINKLIKECCKEVGLEEDVSLTKHSGSNHSTIIKPKYKCISTHAARKTFVTNSLMLGMNLKTIKSITGHKVDKSFERYVMIADDFKKIEMENTWDKIPKKA